MPLTKRSKVKEAWRHPVGHELLQNLLRQQGRPERWIEGPLVSNMTLQNLDRFAGPGFSDMLVEMAAVEPDRPTRVEEEAQVWWKEAVVYQVYPPSFMDSDHDGMGDFRGIAQRLPYMANLGTDTLLLWPVLPGDMGGRGTTDFTAVDPEFGEMEDFEDLVESAHARDMRVVLGLEVAYTSDEHPWFLRALGGEQSQYYVLRPGAADTPPNNWARGTGPMWTWYPDAGVWGLSLAGRHRMDLNWDNPALRAEMAGVLRFWQEKGVDGFYLGPVATLSKAGYEDGSPAALAVTGVCGYERFAYGPRLHRYLRELRAALPEPVMLVGEATGIGTEMARQFCGCETNELDMIQDSSHLLPRARARGEDTQLDLPDLKRYYLRWMVNYGTGCWMPLFLEGPYWPRIVSRLGASPLYRSVLAKLLAMMLLTLRGTPILYQGEALGLPNTRFASPGELRDAASLRMYGELRDKLGDALALQKVLGTTPDHARTPMPWSAGPKAGFTGAEPWMRLVDGTEFLNASAQMEDEGSVWQFYQRLIALRKDAICLVYGSINPVFIKNKKVFCYFRIYNGEKWYVEMNLTEKEVTRPGRITRTQKLALSNYDAPARALRPYEANLYRCEGA